MKAKLIVLITVMALQVAGAREFWDFTNLAGKKTVIEEDSKVKEGK